MTLTQKQRMLAGELDCADDPELAALWGCGDRLERAQQRAVSIGALTRSAPACRSSPPIIRAVGRSAALESGRPIVIGDDAIVGAGSS